MSFFRRFFLSSGVCVLSVSSLCLGTEGEIPHTSGCVIPGEGFVVFAGIAAV